MLKSICSTLGSYVNLKNKKVNSIFIEKYFTKHFNKDINIKYKDKKYILYNKENIIKKI